MEKTNCCRLWFVKRPSDAGLQLGFSNHMKLAAILILSLTYSPALADMSKSPHASDGTLAVLHQAASAFRNDLNKVKVKEIGIGCKAHFVEGDLLTKYFEAISIGNYKHARKMLYLINLQLLCVSARTFAQFHLSFVQHLLMNDNPDLHSAEAIQAIAPVAFRFLEPSNHTLRLSTLVWFRQNLEKLWTASKKPESWLSRIGLHGQMNGFLVNLDSQKLQLTLDSLDTDVWDSGACSLADMVTDPSESQQPRLVCVRDCVLGRAIREGKSVGNALYLQHIARTGSEESSCKSINNAIDDLAASDNNVKIKQCFDAFHEATNVNACLVASAQPDNTQFGPILTNAEPSLEVALKGRQCWTSQACDSACWAGRALEASHRAGEAQLEWEETRDAAAAVRAELGLDEDTTLAELTPSERTRYAQAVRAQKEAADKYAQTKRAEEAAYDGYDEAVEREEEERERDRPDTPTGEGSAAGDPALAYCAPDSGTCSDSCGIVDQRLEETLQCLEERSQDAIGPLPSEPDPRISIPQPDDPGPLPSAYTTFFQCVSSALVSSVGSINQKECSTLLRCADQTRPRGPNCTCLPEQRVGKIPSSCGNLIDCTGEGSCTCGGEGAPIITNESPKGGCPRPETLTNPVARLEEQLAGTIAGAEHNLIAVLPTQLRGLTEPCIVVSPPGGKRVLSPDSIEEQP